MYGLGQVGYYTCSVCGEGFILPELLFQHISSAHPTVKEESKWQPVINAGAGVIAGIITSLLLKQKQTGDPYLQAQYAQQIAYLQSQLNKQKTPSTVQTLILVGVGLIALFATLKVTKII